MSVIPTTKNIIEYLDGRLSGAQKRRLEYCFIHHPQYIALMKGIKEMRKNFKSEGEMEQYLSQQKELMTRKLFKQG